MPLRFKLAPQITPTSRYTGRRVRGTVVNHAVWSHRDERVRLVDDACPIAYRRDPIVIPAIAVVDRESRNYQRLTRSRIRIRVHFGQAGHRITYLQLIVLS